MRIAYAALGGTISSTGVPGSGVRPALDAGRQLAGVDLPAGVSVEAHSLEMLPSVELTLDRIAGISRSLTALVADGADGIVLSTGTDALEEVAWALHLTWPSEVPLIVTGAMRPASAVSPDGPGNVADAVIAAASELTRGLGVLVCFAGELHPASSAVKTHTFSVAGFSSPGAGPLGFVSEGSVLLGVHPTTPRPGLPLAAEHPPVALLPFSLGDDARQLAAVESLGYAGLVLQGFGAGHVSSRWVETAKELAARMPVVLSTRVPTGPVLRNSYGFPGSERDLLDNGLIGSGTLGAHKARVLLSVLLGAGRSPGEIRASFTALSGQA